MAEDLRKYTCDAMAGQEVHSNYRAMSEAKKKIKACGIAFTTCIGAGLGLLRSESFEVVIVDEASQQSEPASLVPLVKGCSKAILVGDHVQLRPTVQQHALLVDFDVSLFERLYTQPAVTLLDGNRHKRSGTDAGDDSYLGETRRLMLDTQYRMHPQVCEFSSKEFYEGRLKTGITRAARPLSASEFPWPLAVPAAENSLTALSAEFERTIFIECAEKERPGQKSKENEGQANLCADVCRLLATPAGMEGGSSAQSNRPAEMQPHVAVLTPYARQADLLKRLVSGLSGHVEVSSIDGFQGREADIVVFVTVRCNEHREIGFLKDLRRMNVALTRARAGLIVIGNRATLTGGISDPESTAMWTRLLATLTPVEIEAQNV